MIRIPSLNNQDFMESVRPGLFDRGSAVKVISDPPGLAPQPAMMMMVVYHLIFHETPP